MLTTAGITLFAVPLTWLCKSWPFAVGICWALGAAETGTVRPLTIPQITISIMSLLLFTNAPHFFRHVTNFSYALFPFLTIGLRDDGILHVVSIQANRLCV